MEKIKSFFLSTNFAMVVFFMVGMRIVVCGASIGDAIALLSLCALQGFNKWLVANQAEPLSDKVARELADIKTHVAGLMIKNGVRPQAPPSQPEAPTVRKFF